MQEETTPSSGVSEAFDQGQAKETDLLNQMGDMFQQEFEPKPEAEPETEPEKAETESSEEPKEEPPEPEQEVQDSDDAEDEGQTLETLADLQEYIGVESLDELRVPIKVDGVESEATLADVLKSYQLESHVNAKSIKISEKEKALETEFEERKAKVGEKLGDLETLQNMLAHKFLGEWQDFDWKKAKEEDPHAAQMKWMDYQTELAEFQALYQKVEAEKQKTADEKARADEAALLTKAKKLSEFFPEWKGNVLKEQSDGIKQFLTNLSFNGVSAAFAEDEIYLDDPRFYPIIHMAMEYQKLKKESPKVTKRVKKAPTGIKAKRRIANKKVKANAARDKKIKQGDENAFLDALTEHFDITESS